MFYFSICVPVYNVEEFIGDCVESVLKQIFQNFELILVDDGSKDDSLKICREYEKKDNRIKVFAKENEGQIATRNYAFSRASGDIILCLDSDDFLEPDTLDKLNKYFTEYDCDCVYYNWKRYSDNKFFIDRKIENKIELIKDKSVLFKKIFGDMYYNSMCLKAFKRELIPRKNESSFHEIRHGEDLIQSIEVLDKSKGVLFIPDVFYNYRVNVNSISHNASRNLFIQGNPVRLFAYKYIKEKNLFTSNDWAEYGKKCASIFFANLFKISKFNISREEKVFILNQEHESEYYSCFIINYKTGAFFKDLFLRLFKIRRYFLLLNLFYILKKIV